MRDTNLLTTATDTVSAVHDPLTTVESTSELQEKGFVREKYNPDELFTYRPKISTASQRITQKSKDDFMTRQLRHIANQKKYYDEAIQYELDIYGRKKSRRSVAETPLEEPKRSLTMPVAADGDKVRQKLSKSVDYTTRYKARDATGTLLRSSFTDDNSIKCNGSPKSKRKSVSLNVGLQNASAERLRNAKLTAERAIKNRKIFTIIGPYHRVRQVLREKGWVEKFYKLHCDDSSLVAPKKKRSNSPRRRAGGGGLNGAAGSPPGDAGDENDDEDDDPDDDDGADRQCDEDECGKVNPWEEEDGIYGIMSRVVRNAAPSFIWSLRKDQVNYRFLHKDQMVNHHAKAHNFTTKVGLCTNLRQLPWFENEDPSRFFPRCHIISVDEEKDSFIEDFRLSACMALIKIVVETEPCLEEEQQQEQKQDEQDPEQVKQEGESVPAVANEESAAPAAAVPAASTTAPATPAEPASPVVSQTPRIKKDKKKILPKIRYACRRKKDAAVPRKALDLAMKFCQSWIRSKMQEDIDNPENNCGFTEAVWDQLIQWYYMVVHHGARIENAESKRSLCESLYQQLADLHPQFLLDGVKNVWIIKPGAKSRGRGIFCCDKLDEMVKLVTRSVTAQHSRYVAQKYIERPLLIYNTKFDIRQWFLVTDWNPLTVWWYKECYFRFCSQEFTLEDFNESVHLSNNAIQYKYENGLSRSSNIPDHNMWDCSEFKSWLRQRGQPAVYDELILPGMKSAVISSLVCTQDLIEYRKNCFELYGADFMITEDYQPWLIEINSSPCMAPSTPVTSRMTAEVLADTVKVVLDRRSERDCSTGKYELIYQQRMIPAPPYVGIDLTVTGNAVRKPWNSSVLLERPKPHPQNGSLFMQEVRHERLEKIQQQRLQQEQNKMAPAKLKQSSETKSNHPPALSNNSSQVKPQHNGHSNGLPNPGNQKKKEEAPSSKLVSTNSVNKVQHAPPSLSKPATRVEIVDLQSPANNSSLRRPHNTTAGPSYSKTRSECNPHAEFIGSRSVSTILPFAERTTTLVKPSALLPSPSAISSTSFSSKPLVTSCSAKSRTSNEWWRLPDSAGVNKPRTCPTEHLPYAKLPLQFPEPTVRRYQPKISYFHQNS